MADPHLSGEVEFIEKKVMMQLLVFSLYSTFAESMVKILQYLCGSMDVEPHA